PNTTTISIVAHLAPILMNPITNQTAIPQENIYNPYPLLIDTTLIR
ncbi:34806_t:CDS:1, partial [Gigaspora margarita]